MTTKLTQATVRRALDKHPPGVQLHDDQVSGLRLVVGKTSASYKLVGRINDGSKRYVSIVVGRTDEVSLKDARDEATRLRLALRRGEDPRSRKTAVPNVGAALDAYLAGRPDLSPATVEWYRKLMRGPLAPLRTVPMDKLERTKVRALHERITKTAPTMANGAMRLLKALANDVARTHDLPPNVVSRAVKMNKDKVRDWAVRPEDMSALWSAIDGLEDERRRTAWTALLTTGLRSHDVRSMRWEHVDRDRVLTVPCPKGGEDRAFRLPLTRFLLQRLEALPRTSDWIFPAASRTGYLSELRRTDAFPYAPHAMRHTWRTMALEAGVDLSMAMVLMNHKPQGVTWNYVTKANLLGPMRDAAERVCSTLTSYRGQEAP
ncbi:uncharacterized protein DUF4102 [Hasllibacter halocynthiae]|uniref:Uncharacterized protein DUF4102 n=1 Tax=Hasllibacter halocynthiae TaxID=595589 RepID=A0A2T0X7U2_9RHOB|nr:integrase family protein [Hasllibacter halocynthiae]PRY94965.1 uncharacterized protein DUF4102 [Hasllibacter halocynthiae]